MMEDLIWLIWFGTGFLTYVVVVIIEAINKPDWDFNKDVATNPTSGQAFLILLCLGCLSPFIVISLML
jgi:hypothetical protein